MICVYTEERNADLAQYSNAKCTQDRIQFVPSLNLHRLQLLSLLTSIDLEYEFYTHCKWMHK